jgi:hypothetical protein
MVTFDAGTDVAASTEVVVVATAAGSDVDVTMAVVEATVEGVGAGVAFAAGLLEQPARTTSATSTAGMRVTRNLRPACSVDANAAATVRDEPGENLDRP